MVSRRSFFKGLAAAAAAAAAAMGSSPAFAIIAGDPRVEAWRLLEESRVLFAKHGKSPAYFTKTEELFDHLTVHFKPSIPPSFEEAVQECSDFLKRRGVYEDGPLTETHWRTCYNSTFAVMIVRTGLRDYKLPMIQAKNWKPFAKDFTKIVMAA